MMKCLLALGWLLLVASCQDTPEKGDQPQVVDTLPATNTTPSPFFPVKDYLAGEIAYVDSLPVGIKKYTTTGTRVDSTYIQPQEFHDLAQEFLLPEVSEKQYQDEFGETAFFDQTTGSATFYYAPKQRNHPIRRIDVLSAKGDVYDQVKSIFIQKHVERGDTVIMKKLFWKPKKNFQMVEQITIKGGSPSEKTVKVVWDNSEELD